MLISIVSKFIFFPFFQGEDFWNVPAKKIYAITFSDYQKKKNKGIGAEGKTKDINQRESLWIWTCWTKYQRNWMTQLKCVKVTAYCPLALKKILSAVSVLRWHALSQSLAAVSDCLFAHLVQRGGMGRMGVAQYAKAMMEEKSISL